MAMGSIFAKTDVGNDKQTWESRPKSANGLNDRPLRIIGSGSKSIFGTLSHWYAKQNDGTEALLNERRQVWDDFIDASTMLVRERRDQDFLVWLIRDEQGIDEHRLEA